MKLKNKKTGELGTLTLSNDGETFILMNERMYTHSVKLKDLEEWEDVPEEPKEYWFINSCGAVEVRAEEEQPAVADMHKQFGNYFETKEGAEKAVEKLKAWKRLKDKGFEFTNWEFKYVLDGSLVIEAGLNFDNDSNIQRDLEICFGGEE